MTYTLISSDSSCRDGVEYVKTIPKEHVAPSTIQHWQLRDLVCCPVNRSEVYYIQQNQINLLHTPSRTSTPVFNELQFSPTSITAACGYLAAGGQRSQLVVKSLTGSGVSQVNVGGSINNALNISSHCGQTRLLISNNDETIKVFSLPDLIHITDIQLPTAVNNASVSPDGTKLIAVGDSNDVFLFDIRNGYQRITSFKASNDSSFSCSWNHSSEKFAVASQDGYVSVWDLRKTEKLAKLSAKQLVSNIPLTGACRNVKFSPTSSIDLLVFSEHTSFVHLVDARTFNEQQIIKVPSNSSDPDAKPDICGLTFSPDAKSLFIGTQSMIAEYDVDTVSRRCFPLGSII